MFAQPNGCIISHLILLCHNYPCVFCWLCCRHILFIIRHFAFCCLERYRFRTALRRYHRFRHFIDQPDITVVDPDLLSCAARVAFGSFSDLDPLDEDMEYLAGEFVDLGVLPCVFKEAADVCGRVLELLKAFLCFGKRFFDLGLFLGVIL